VTRVNKSSRQEEPSNEGYKRTLELMLDMETKLNKKYLDFTNEVKGNITKVNTKIEHANRVNQENEQRMNDIEA